MSAFFEALDEGYTPDQVLGYLSKSIPKMGSLIKKAQRSGYPAQQILGFLSKNFDTEDRTGMSTSERRAANIRADSERAKYGLQLAGAAIATPLVARAAQGALARALPSSLTQGVGLPGIGNGNLDQSLSQQQTFPQQATGNQPIDLQSQSTLPSQPPISPNIPQQQTQIQPEIKPIDVKQILSKYPGFESKLNEMMTSGNSAEAMSTYFKKFNPSQTSKLEKETGKPIEEIVSEYMQSQPQVENSAKIPEIPKVEEKISPEIEKIEEKPIKIEKGTVAASPQGIGEIKEIRNGKAIIEVDGKKHQVNEDELIQSPIPEKDLGELFEELQNEIEKSTGQEISKNVEYAAYSPENRELLYKPHSGEFYVYDDISPEIADELINLLTVRRTTGENHIGAWTKNTKSPIGNRMHDLIKKLQSERGGKGNEYRSKYQTIYDALEPAREAKKRLHAERKKKAKKPRFD